MSATEEFYIKQSAEAAAVAASVGSPMETVHKNYLYLISKYDIRERDCKKAFEYLKISHVTLRHLSTGKVKNISVFVLTLFVAFLRRKYGAEYSVGDLFVDLEARERLQNF